MIRRTLPLAALLLAGTAQAAPQLTPVWQDHAIIQRDRPVVVEGTAEAGARIAGSLGGAHATATAGADGSFSLTFPARAASAEPITLHVTDGTDEVTTIEDILVGDVYLCSGQSNMAFTVSAGLNGYNNIQASTDPLLRMLTVPLDTAAAPASEFGGAVSWQSASPQTTGGFSAACYYMLENLREALDIPLGAVHSSWGGSQIRAWLTPEAGAAIYGADQMALLDGYARDRLAAVTEFAPLWENWWREAKGNEPWSNPDALEWRPVPSISPWTSWEDGPAVVDTVWFRHQIELTPEQAAAGGTLNIGIIDDLDATWVNGHPVGINHGWSTERVYAIPAEFLREGANEIVFAGSNSWGGGGMQSGADRLSFTVEGGERISLAEGWLYSDGEIGQQPPRAPWDANAGIGVMHNRMIAPIGRYAMTGAAWYQGESDVGIPGYVDRQRELFAGWRRQFGEDLRVMVVQLANYGTPASEPVESGWAALRQDQLDAVVADSNAALVTAIDIGEWSDIHPTNKVLLGRRLALAAQKVALPMPQSATRQGGLIRVGFSGVEGALASWSSPIPISFELCGEDQTSCRFAMASLSGNSAYLADDGRPASRVRYAWSDAPVVNTFDARNLPLPGFELRIEDGE